MNGRDLQVVDFLQLIPWAVEEFYIAMSNECCYDFLLSRIDYFDDSHASGNSQKGILGSLIASPCTDTQLFINLNVSFPSQR